MTRCTFDYTQYIICQLPLLSQLCTNGGPMSNGHYGDRFDSEFHSPTDGGRMRWLTRHNPVARHSKMHDADISNDVCLTLMWQGTFGHVCTLTSSKWKMISRPRANFPNVSTHSYSSAFLKWGPEIAQFVVRHTVHQSKILQHPRITASAHTYTRRMRSVCNHHSKILQHHRDACDPFVIITPRFYNIIASPAHTHTHIRRIRSVCKL